MAEQKATDDQIIDCIRRFIDERGWPPTVRELGECVGLSSSSSVKARLQRLVDEGRIERVMNGPHTKLLRIIEEVSDGN